jgi:GTP-binding protein HflX
MNTVNKTLQELNAFEKPTLTVFNKLDLYEANTFDEWLDDETKKQMLQDLEKRWQAATNNNAVFISATERLNVDVLRRNILDKVRALYKIRYPYKTEYFF